MSWRSFDSPRDSGDAGQDYGASRDLETEVATFLSDDPELDAHITPPEEFRRIAAESGVPCRMPVVLFELQNSVKMSMPDGSRPEIQTEMIIQSGFTRGRQSAEFRPLQDWTVRHTSVGLELWDHAKMWAHGKAAPDANWQAEAIRYGLVLAIYGADLGLREQRSGRRGGRGDARGLKAIRIAGMVAASLVPWRSMPVPETVHYPGPTYNSATGTFQIAAGAYGLVGNWQLNRPARGVCHGLILGDRRTGKTNALRIIMIEALQTQKFAIFAADPLGRGGLPLIWGKAAEMIAESPRETIRMLEAVDAIITARLADGTYTDPVPGRPGILIAVDDCQHVFAGNRAAVKLAERVVAKGGPVCVGMVAAAAGADLAYFGGSTTLRDGLAADNCAAFGSNALDLLSKVRKK